MTWHRWISVTNPVARHQRNALALLVVAALIASCAMIRREDTLQTERTLAAAGFQMKFADTPAQKAALDRISPERSLVPQQYEGETRFVYADPEYCKCMYVGTQAAHQRYQRLALKQQLAQDRLAAAEAREDAAMNWGMWGGWGPWY